MFLGVCVRLSGWPGWPQSQSRGGKPRRGIEEKSIAVAVRRKKWCLISKESAAGNEEYCSSTECSDRKIRAVGEVHISRVLKS